MPRRPFWAAVWSFCGVKSPPTKPELPMLNPEAPLILAGAVFTALDALTQVDFLTSPKSKVAAGWLVTGLIFLSLGLRGRKAYRRKPVSRDQSPSAKPSS